MIARNVFLGFVCIGAVACSAAGAGPEALDASGRVCKEAPAEYRLAIDDRPVATRTQPGLGAIRATGVIARDGCVSIDGPLAAINWWTTTDRDLLTTKYDAVVGPEVLKHARIIFAGDVLTTLKAAEPPLLDHQSMAVVLYRSAASFAEMIGSQIHLEVIDFKEDAVAEGYSFGFQRCVVGCEDPNVPAFPPQIRGRALVVHYAMPKAKAGEVDQAYGRIRDALARDGRAALAFAGRAIGSSFRELEDGTRMRPFATGGIDGTLIFEFEKVGDAERILVSPDVSAFLDDTAAHVAVTFGDWGS